MKVLAFIPARGGSKGIPGKNLFPVNGKPLVQYTLEAARQSKYIDEIFLSSDDPKIIEFCRSLGLSVPYRRPDNMATDEAPTVDAIVDGLEWLKAETGQSPTNIIVLQPTSPLRTAEDIDGAIEVFNKTEAESLISVNEMEEHPYKCMSMAEGGWRYLAKPLQEVHRRQDYSERFYSINGAIYISNTEFFLREKKLTLEGKTELYLMDRINGIDIDDMHGLRLAEFYMKNRALFAGEA